MNSTEKLLGNYIGSRCVGPNHDISKKNYDCVVTPIEAFTKANSGGITSSSPGCDINKQQNQGPMIDTAAALAKESDAVILVMGIDSTIEREGLDRVNTTLPGAQPALVEAVAKAAAGKPVVLVLLNGGMLSLGNLRGKVSAIVEGFYAGEAAATALASIIFGGHNPSGKLAATAYPPEYVEQIPLTDMGLTSPPGRTYLHYTGTPEFKYGTGLSFTTWSLRPAGTASAQQEHIVLDTTQGRGALLPHFVDYKLMLTNTGDRAGKQVIMGFVRPLSRKSGWNLPIHRLFAYKGVHLAPGAAVQATLRLQLSDDVDKYSKTSSTNLALAWADNNGNLRMVPGDYEIIFSLGDGTGEGGNERVVGGSVRVKGPELILEHAPFAQ